MILLTIEVNILVSSLHSAQHERSRAVLLEYRCYRQVHVVKGGLRAADDWSSLSVSLWVRGSDTKKTLCWGNSLTLI